MAGVKTKIKLLIAYPSFKPWYMVADRVEGKEGVYPIKVEVKLNDKLNKRANSIINNRKFVYRYPEYGLSLYKSKYHNIETAWEELCPDSYYYPTNKNTLIEDFSIDYIECPSLCWPQDVMCKSYVFYSDHLFGHYIFRHLKFEQFPEIDKEVRKLVEKFMHPAGREQVYFVNFNKAGDSKEMHKKIK
jgi:hypothetical protein